MKHFHKSSYTSRLSFCIKTTLFASTLFRKMSRKTIIGRANRRLSSYALLSVTRALADTLFTQFIPEVICLYSVGYDFLTRFPVTNQVKLAAGKVLLIQQVMESVSPTRCLFLKPTTLGRSSGFTAIDKKLLLDHLTLTQQGK